MNQHTRIDPKLFDELMEAVTDLLPENFGAVLLVAPEPGPGDKVTVSVGSCFDPEQTKFIIDSAAEETQAMVRLSQHRDMQS